MLKKLVMLLAVFGMMFGAVVATSGTASAGAGDFVRVCTNESDITGGGPGGRNQVACSVVVSGNDVDIEIGDVNVLSDNELKVLVVALNNFLNKNTLVVILKDLQVEVVKIFKNDLDIEIEVCQVKIIEIGLINFNLAKC